MTFIFPEMRAVIRALQRFPLPSGATVLVSTDNSTVVAYVNKEGGLVPSPLGGDGETVRVGFLSPDHAESSTHPGEDECHRRPPVPTRPGPSHRVVPESGGHVTYVQPVGVSPRGSLRDEVEHQTAKLCVPSAGPTGARSGRPVHAVGQPVGVRFPTTPAPHQSATVSYTHLTLPTKA